MNKMVNNKNTGISFPSWRDDAVEHSIDKSGIDKLDPICNDEVESILDEKRFNVFINIPTSKLHSVLYSMELL